MEVLIKFKLIEYFSFKSLLPHDRNVTSSKYCRRYRFQLALSHFTLFTASHILAKLIDDPSLHSFNRMHCAHPTPDKRAYPKFGSVQTFKMNTSIVIERCIRAL